MGWENAEAGIAAAVGVDMWSGNRMQVVPYPRRIMAAALIGGDTVGVGKVDIYVGSVYRGTLTVTTASQALDKQKDILPQSIVVPANTMLHVFITEVTATNSTINWFLFDR
ncbi:hypothetical protein LCGC14_1803870 [marine sediment metagenome]|uniref:Uncharacterized protein n=1 Tax=marine sediment metagenome TaxID=412755 RepID=A0A0F9GNP7_9ZZZZ